MSEDTDKLKQIDRTNTLNEILGVMKVCEHEFSTMEPNLPPMRRQGAARCRTMLHKAIGKLEQAGKDGVL